jgi:hypothetical protein
VAARQLCRGNERERSERQATSCESCCSFHCRQVRRDLILPTLCLNGKVVFAVFPVERMDLDQIDFLFCERCQDQDKRAGNMFQPECKDCFFPRRGELAESGPRRKHTIEASSSSMASDRVARLYFSAAVRMRVEIRQRLRYRLEPVLDAIGVNRCTRTTKFSPRGNSAMRSKVCDRLRKIRRRSESHATFMASLR